MAVEITGTAQWFQPTYYGTCPDCHTAGSATITVPADCTLILVNVTMNSLGSSNPMMDLNGTDPFTSAIRFASGSPGYTAIIYEYLVNPATGSQTLNWTTGANFSSGMNIVVSYWKGVDTDDPIGAIGGPTQNVQSVSVSSCGTGDQLIGCYGSFNKNLNHVPAAQNQINIREMMVAAPRYHYIGVARETGTGDTIFYATGTTDASVVLAAMVLKEAATGPTEVEKIGTASTYYRPFYASNDAEGSQGVVVPADCDCIVATYVCNWPNNYNSHWYQWSPPFFKLGSTPFQKAVAIYDPESNNDQVVIIEVLPAPTTGAGTLYWDTTLLETVNPTEGVVIIWDYYKNVDPDDPLVDVAKTTTAGGDLTGMSYSTGDMMVGAVMSDGTSPTITDNGQTQVWKVQAGEANRDNWGGLAYKVSSGDFYWTLTVGNGAAAAIVLRFFVEDAFLYRNSVAGLGMSDTQGSIEAEVGVLAGIGFDEDSNQDKDLAGNVDEGLGFTALAYGLNASVWDSAAGIGLTEIAEAFNLSDYLRAYGSVLVYSYQVILTGAADGLPDYVLTGVKSVSIRLRQGEPSYLQAVLVYGDAALDALLARPNGDVVAYMIARANGVEILREALLNAAYDSTRFDRGGDSQSITLIGYRTQSFGGAAVPVPLADVTTESMAATGLMRYRCARPDFYLKPGDTATYGAVSFTVNMITYSIAPGSVFMDVSE